MNILDDISIELPCVVCGGQYQISLEKVLISEHMLHEGCPVPMPYTTECPPLSYGHLVDHHLIHELQQIWLRLEESANTAGGKLVLREVQART
jgi:hypothetical protein